MTQDQKKKLADVFCDFGKYIATAVPLAIYVADKSGIGYVVIATTLSGVLFVSFGLYIGKLAEKGDGDLSNARKRKVKILKNAVFQIEEQQL